MKIIPKLKKFITENRNLIDSCKFTELYQKINKELFSTFDDTSVVSSLTRLLWEADIDPLVYMQSVPTNYMSYQDIEYFEVPRNIKKIEYGSFKNCDKLKNIIIDEGVEKIDTEAFLGCFNLDRVDLPSTIKEIEEGAFLSCEKAHFYYEGTEEEWSKVEGHDSRFLIRKSRPITFKK